AAAGKTGRRDRAWNAGVGSGVGVADVGEKRRDLPAIQLHGLVLADRTRRQRRGREHQRVEREVLERAPVSRLELRAEHLDRIPINGLGYGPGPDDGLLVDGLDVRARDGADQLLQAYAGVVRFEIHGNIGARLEQGHRETHAGVERLEVRDFEL